MNERTTSLWRLVPLYVACYVLWIVFIAVTMWTLLQWRNVLLGLVTVVGPWAMSAVDKFGVLLFGLIAVAWLIYLENYLREGIDKEIFWRRVVRVTVIQAVVLAVAYGLQFLDVLF